MNIYASSKAEKQWMNSLIGGIINQEIFKTINKFILINQWEIFNFSH